MPEEFIPEVNPANEFLEISKDFTNPKELLREAISNSFDANANEITFESYIDKSSGIDELVIEILDNGDGMDIREVKSFFGLGLSTRTEKDDIGNKVGDFIGEKGHGTKVYFNSDLIHVETVKSNRKINASMANPYRILCQGLLPKVRYEISNSENESYTKVIIRGYNQNEQKNFDHNWLKDYILWFTKFGSIEKQFDMLVNEKVQFKLKGLGKSNFENLNFGHKFAMVNTTMSSLRLKDKVDPLSYYVANWVFKGVPVKDYPNSKIDFIFYIEGDKAKREYNTMIHEKYSSWEAPGQYNVEWRYGLWLCKDYGTHNAF